LAPPHFPDRPSSAPTAEGVKTIGGILTPELHFKELSGLEIHVLWREAEADSVDLGKGELATMLLTLGVKYNYGLPPGIVATQPQIAGFWRSILIMRRPIICSASRCIRLGETPKQSC